MEKIELTSMNCRLCLVLCNKKDAEFEEYKSLYEKFYDDLVEEVVPRKLCKACVNYVIRLSCFHRRIIKTQEKISDPNAFLLRCRLCFIECSKTDFDAIDAMPVINSCTGLEMQEADAIGKVCSDCLVEIETLSSCLKNWKGIENTLLNKADSTQDVGPEETNSIWEHLENVPTLENNVVKKVVRKITKTVAERDKKEHFCEHCGFHTTSYVKYRRHRYNMHVSIGPFSCDLCSNSVQFKNKLYLKRHMQRKHLPPKKPLTCEQCGIQVQYHQDLFYHRKRMHTDVKDYKHECTYCGRRFFKKSRLNDHMDTHTGIKRAKCDICGNAFKNSYEMKQHRKVVHTSEKNFFCTVCGKAFACQDYLSGHMRCHYRNYHCPVCTQSFTVPATLRSHVAKLHPDFKMPPQGTLLKNFDWSTYIIAQNNAFVK